MIVKDEMTDQRTAVRPMRVKMAGAEGLNELGKRAYRRESIGVQRPGVKDQPFKLQGVLSDSAMRADPGDALRFQDADRFPLAVLFIPERERQAAVRIFGAKLGGKGQGVPFGRRNRRSAFPLPARRSRSGTDKR